MAAATFKVIAFESQTNFCAARKLAIKSTSRVLSHCVASAGVEPNRNYEPRTLGGANVLEHTNVRACFGCGCKIYGGCKRIESLTSEIEIQHNIKYLCNVANSTYAPTTRKRLHIIYNRTKMNSFWSTFMADFN